MYILISIKNSTKEKHRKENCVKYFRKFVDSKFGKPSNECIIYPITVDTVDFIVWTIGKVSGTQLVFAFDASKTFFVVGSRLCNSFFGVKDHALASKNKKKYSASLRYQFLFFVFTNALSFNRSQYVLGWSKFFLPDQKFIYILWQSQTFCARQKDDLHSVKLVFVPAQKFLKRH